MEERVIIEHAYVITGCLKTGKVKHVRDGRVLPGGQLEYNTGRGYSLKANPYEWYRSAEDAAKAAEGWVAREVIKLRGEIKRLNEMQFRPQGM